MVSESEGLGRDGNWLIETIIIYLQVVMEQSLYSITLYNAQTNLNISVL